MSSESNALRTNSNSNVSGITYTSPSAIDKRPKTSDMKNQQILVNTMENKDYMIIQALYRKDNHMILDNTKDRDDAANKINLKSVGDSLGKNPSIMRAKHRMLLKVAGKPSD